MTPAKLHILRHSIGRDEAGHMHHGCKEEYRNYYATESGCDSYCAVQELVAEGLMKFTGKTGFSTMEYFHVTDAGREAALRDVKHPQLTRSQRRYRAFLSCDFGLSFGEWLRGEKARKQYFENRVAIE